MVYDNKIYFGAGTFKEVYKQLQNNPNAEICASNGKTFLRYYGKVKFNPDPKIVQSALEAMPELKKIYNEKTGYKLGMFYIDNGIAEFRNVLGINESVSL